MSKARKAFAAFLIPLLGLPLAGWITGEEPFSMGVVLGAVATAAVAAFTVYFTPNAAVSPEQF